VTYRSRLRSAKLATAGFVAAAALAAPTVIAAHTLTTAYQSPLPLVVYLVGAASVVALSFVFVLARDLRAPEVTAGRTVPVPRAARLGLRAVGLVGWTWIMVQGVVGGSSDAAVASLFLWVYGWVGLALLSALAFPVWEWLDPFATLFDIGAAGLRRLGVRGWAPTGVPKQVRGWPAVAGFVFFVWLELVAAPGTAGLTLALALYTALTLALMAEAGRDAWRAQGETFTVWFRTLNRLAPYGGIELGLRMDGSRVVRRPFATGLLEGSWPVWRIALIAVGVASIIYDGLSQTVAFASLVGSPGVLGKTLLLAGFLLVVASAAVLVGRAVSPGAIGAGLLPIAVGYLVAHYLTYLLIDGQRIVIAISDPLQTGADLFGTAFFTVQTGWLPPGLVWTIQLAAVIAGHMVGAWAGHVCAQRDMTASARTEVRAARASRAAGKEPRDLRHRKIRGAAPPRDARLREIPLALVMVALSVLTLWSLGQTIVRESTSSSGAVPVELARRP
jgi:hypothetical protein